MAAKKWTCPICGNSYHPTGSTQHKISMHGRHTVKPRPTWVAIPKVTANGCNEWQGMIDAGGYGRMRAGKKAHRVIFEIYRGPVPDGLELDHLCNNRRCVNPDHLEAVTHAENCRRKYARMQGVS